VKCTRRNHNRVTVTDKMFLLVIDDEPGVALFNTKELINVGMYFFAYFCIRLQTHNHKLTVLSGE
jgi:hypothetical protein